MNSVTNFLNYQPNCFLFHTFCKKHPLRCEIDEKECEDYRRYINYQLKKRLDFPAEEPDLYFDIVPEMESFAKKYVENILFVMEGIRSCSNNVMVGQSQILCNRCFRVKNRIKFYRAATALSAAVLSIT